MGTMQRITAHRGKNCDFVVYVKNITVFAAYVGLRPLVAHGRKNGKFV